MLANMTSENLKKFSRNCRQFFVVFIRLTTVEAVEQWPCLNGASKKFKNKKFLYYRNIRYTRHGTIYSWNNIKNKNKKSYFHIVGNVVIPPSLSLSRSANFTVIIRAKIYSHVCNIVDTKLFRKMSHFVCVRACNGNQARYSTYALYSLRLFSILGTGHGNYVQHSNNL